MDLLAHVEFGLSNNWSDVVAKAKTLGHRVAIISDSNCARLYANGLLQAIGKEATLLTFPAGEASKTRDTKADLEDQLAAQGFNRDCVIIAVGGGVVLDMAGFVAATFCRGVPCIYIPTSLLAMVDATIGGKVAVNTPYGKNLIGAFKEPEHVFVFAESLQTLPEIEFKSGLVELIKHALIERGELLRELQQAPEAIQQPKKLLALIQKSLSIKANIVQQDFHDQGRRHILNAGHTYGHALEVLMDYQIPHGLAVAFGLVKETQIAVKQNMLAQQRLDEIIALFKAFEISYQIDGHQFSEAKWQAALAQDKKNIAGKINISFLPNANVFS